jgi:4'-phosphopantetheinyl transferase EntD
MTEDDLAAALARLVSRPDIAVAAVRAGEHTLYPEEQTFVARAVPARRADFAAGRTAARRALGALGIEPRAIPSGERRAPVWPEGTVGSISHSGGWAVAAVARSSDVFALGLDIEVAAPLPEDVEALVVGPRDRLGSSNYRATIAFSAKESVYKALQPARGWLLEFADVELELEGESFTAIARSMRLGGRWSIEQGMIATIAIVDQERAR